eukprot:scaffold710_cov171-Amphora_coffeaeformis.AAC.23
MKDAMNKGALCERGLEMALPVQFKSELALPATYFSGFLTASSAKFRVICPEFSPVPGYLPRVQYSSGFFAVS